MAAFCTVTIHRLLAARQPRLTRTKKMLLVIWIMRQYKKENVECLSLICTYRFSFVIYVQDGVAWTTVKCETFARTLSSRRLLTCCFTKDVEGHLVRLPVPLYSSITAIPKRLIETEKRGIRKTKKKLKSGVIWCYWYGDDTCATISLSEIRFAGPKWWPT